MPSASPSGASSSPSSRSNSLPGDSDSSSSSNSDGQTGSDLPGSQSSASSGGRDTATGDLVNGRPVGSQGAGDYSLDTLPDGVLSGRDGTANSPSTSPGSSTNAGTSANGAGVLTSAERAAVLDERLRRGYEDFDGFILDERARAQTESNAAGSMVIGTADSGLGGSGNASASSNAANQSGILETSQNTVSSPARSETFPPPQDIPTGRDDDVVARQLREAAMSEPDAQLREKLWQEYRNYTGTGDQ
ncbi:MAG: hypothetical protein COC19_02480 [SAR86 cluster bacterium]|uniref:Uncharacterized protein n=1 Tax=SAR86 cluster bacterium TaxID=2030880 RepID=A0A2A4MSC1_9GAMM|nr:MAG: hypothetical protein COC19_02480 [SAR86 cluster bacterium]